MAFRTKLTVAYLGSALVGWQRQSRGRSVQGELEDALARLTGCEPMPVIGAGRTDAGVHAAGQVAHVDVPDRLPVGRLPDLLNRQLGRDVRIVAAARARPDFHARFDATAKRYVYRLRWTRPQLPWQALRVAVAPLPRDHSAFADAARLLVGGHDFASFTVPEAARECTFRTLYELRFQQRPGGLELSFLGDGFLRYQIRRMVGALLEVGAGRRGPEWIKQMLNEPEAGRRIVTAPAHGLTLERVHYRPIAVVDSAVQGPTGDTTGRDRRAGKR